jgi:hypothetical protein
MKLINRLNSFDSLCRLIAQELAVFHDGVENTAKDFYPDSVAVANAIRNHFEVFLSTRPPDRIYDDLCRVFGIHQNTNHKANDFQPTIRAQVASGVSRDGRKSRRRSSASRVVYLGRDGDPRLAKC